MSSSSRPRIQRPSSQDTPTASADFTLSPTAVTHQFPGSATSSPSLMFNEEDDFYGGSSRINQRTNYGPSVTIAGSSSPPRQVPSGLLLPDF
ncbi:unnamed protein product [Cylindrotheca closterium]|uniref:Uncharacterized protein n=1 Tax=Cylindrotheca closterium TaxID=2856 RepID=A0AAD2JGQ1_9STRA|nr:unnamed protein product [Cylindrotheca closterium]